MTLKIRKLLAPGALALSLAMLALTSESASAAINYAATEKGKAFIDEMVSKHGFDANELDVLFASVDRYDAVINAMSKPAEKALNWGQYRPIFIKPGRIESALEFALEHEQLLDQVEAEYGVPREIIVAIIGVESWFGKYKGKHPALQSLATLAFDYPRRAKFFRRELEEFLLLSRDEGFSPLDIKGSYAAAMGMPQFISSSYRQYAVDADGDGKRDLFGSVADICASVANYFVKHGWESGAAVTREVTGELQLGAAAEAMAEKGYKPSFGAADFSKIGVSSDLAHNAQAALVKLEAKQGFEYWVGYKNFYVITRYNHSPMYAMAVFQLAQSIKKGLVVHKNGG